MNAIIISLLIGTTHVGIFNNSIVFIDTLSVIPLNMRRIFIPSLYSALKKNDKNKFQFTFDTMSKYFGIISAFITIILFIYAREIILLVFGKKYILSVDILKILSLAIPFVFNIATIIIVGLDKQVVLTKILLVATLLNIIFNLVLIKLYGLSGAAYSVVATYGIIFIMGYGYLYLYEKLHIYKIIKYYSMILFISIITLTLYMMTDIKQMPMYISFLVICVVYSSLIVLGLIRKNDIKIIKEMIGLR